MQTFRIDRYSNNEMYLFKNHLRNGNCDSEKAIHSTILICEFFIDFVLLIVLFSQDCERDSITEGQKNNYESTTYGQTFHNDKSSNFFSKFL